MFSSLLIANRGEIACRVIRTARRMGLRTIAVYSDADADALHVAMADEAFRIGPAPARESYLRGDVILDVARRAGAQAVHPGYGFLSENADFAEACAAAGVVFVGPPAAAIRAMGGKSEAKALMQQAGVPLVPGYHGAAQDLPTLAAAAAAIGFPVLIKASAGGGGKGMRVVTDPSALEAALLGAKREAASSFGDDRVLIERYLTRPRHIEIQVFADTHGNCVHLFERDCSVQRRHQKVIEEAPAPGMTQAMRAAMGEAAVAAARAVGYVGAGTVEFIVEDDRFAFMEMNTRLQVEHPVTEAITGLDLVEWQLRVAAGAPLPLTQAQLSITGHAFEARLCAEDPLRDFLPQVGRLTHLSLPDDIRVDAGVRQGDVIGIDYDPMIAKLIVHGPDRATALRLLAAALGRCAVVGVQTNLALLRGIATAADFAAGDFDTGFIARHPALLAPTPEPDAAVIAAAVLAVIGDAPAPRDPWGAGDGWRLNLPGGRAVVLDPVGTVTAVPAGAAWRLSWGETHVLARLEPGRVIADGVSRPVSVVPLAGGVVVIADGVNHAFTRVDRLAPPEAAALGGGRVLAPIPGRVAAVLVAVGDAVAAGQTLVVMEAMKMEISLTAPAAGRVASLHAVAGEMVAEGTELVVVEAPAPPA
jgi:3-methylcrotonyl-CoA carboxylase alpha subunit